MNALTRALSLLSLSLLLTACASTAPKPAEPAAPAAAAAPAVPAAPTKPATTALDDAQRLQAISEADSDYERDRRAILAMLGEYEVGFDFMETVVLQPGYARTPRKVTPAYETVVLIADSGRFISLQHLLVDWPRGGVVKHWRQDWTYEAKERWEFTEDQTWRVKKIDKEKTQGAWTQCVYEVSDAPRYCGTAKWNHKYGAPTWTSDRSWRPLPRREYTVRSDYNALNVENRHTITPSGWTHEQDNTKAIRKGEKTDKTLVREYGFNDYRRISGFDFKPAYDYWDKTAAYWTRVRAEWDARIAAHGGVTLKTPVDGMALIGPMFAQAEREKRGESVSPSEIRALFEQWVGAPGAAAAPPANEKKPAGKSY